MTDPPASNLYPRLFSPFRTLSTTPPSSPSHGDDQGTGGGNGRDREINTGVLPEFRYALKPMRIIILNGPSEQMGLKELLQGFIAGIDSFWRVRHIIWKPWSVAAKCPPLKEDVNLSEKQVRAILQDPFHTIDYKRKGYVDEIKSLTKEIPKLAELLSSRDNIMQLIKQEAVELKRQFSDPRRTMLVASDDGQSS